MPFVQKVLSGQYDDIDPERARFQEEIRRQARRDATAATDAVRTKLRRDLIAAANPKQKARTRPPAADSPAVSSQTRQRR